MRKVLEKALKNLIGEDFKLNKFIFTDVSETNIREAMTLLGFTQVTVTGNTMFPIQPHETLITDRFVFIGVNDKSLILASEVDSVEGIHITLKGNPIPVMAYTFIKPTGPARELPEELRKPIWKALKKV